MMGSVYLRTKILTKRQFLLALLAVVPLIIIACGSPAPTVTPVPVATPIPAAPTATTIPAAPAATPIPAAPTAIPTPPPPTATPTPPPADTLIMAPATETPGGAVWIASNIPDLRSETGLNSAHAQ